MKLCLFGQLSIHNKMIPMNRLRFERYNNKFTVRIRSKKKKIKSSKLNMHRFHEYSQVVFSFTDFNNENYSPDVQLKNHLYTIYISILIISKKKKTNNHIEIIANRAHFFLENLWSWFNYGYIQNSLIGALKRCWIASFIFNVLYARNNNK